ncbi:MAG: transglutaminase family protein [Spirochaetaceae bacterium]|nr:MAG: transglutaminase family protein [Spirochaetaceae bacterium]
MSSSPQFTDLEYERSADGVYKLNYDVRAEMDTPIRNHAWCLRLSLPDDDFFEVEHFSRYVEPECSPSTAVDYLGQEYSYGLVREDHSVFRYGLSATIRQHSSYGRRPDTVPIQIFLRSDRLTELDHKNIPWLAAFQSPDKPKDPLEWSIGAMHEITQNMIYLTGTTNYSTPAGDAVSQGSGVCQDFAHILIGLCRAHGVPARYVNGFFVGEGETHAWVEVFVQGRWYGLDPTHNRLVVQDYVPLARGRNAEDCSLNRGVWSSVVQQHQRISASLVEVGE